MEVIKQGRVVTDPVQHLADDAEIPADGRFSVSLSRWLEEASSLARTGRAGVRINGEDDLSELVDSLDAVDHVALEFPKYADGRCYSFARLLRDRYGYQGELRATGDVLRDQLFYMLRCGIDTFEVREDKDVAAALDAFDDFSLTYQTAADGRPPVYQR